MIKPVVALILLAVIIGAAAQGDGGSRGLVVATHTGAHTCVIETTQISEGTEVMETVCVTALPFDCSFKAPAGVTEYDVVYRNWTGQDAQDFHLEFTQFISHLPDEADPPLPTLTVTTFGTQAETVTTDVIQDDETAVIKRKKVKFSLTDGEVAAGNLLEMTVNGEGLELAGRTAATWTKANGTEIDKSKTDGLMGRRSFTEDPPEGANDFHMEYKDELAGVWVEKGKADIAFSVSANDTFPHKLDFDSFVNSAPPFQFAVDFAAEAASSSEGQDPRRASRDGRRWWTNDGALLGDIIEGP